MLKRKDRSQNQRPKSKKRVTEQGKRLGSVGGLSPSQLFGPSGLMPPVNGNGMSYNGMYSVHETLLAPPVNKHTSSRHNAAKKSNIGPDGLNQEEKMAILRQIRNETEEADIRQHSFALFFLSVGR